MVLCLCSPGDVRLEAGGEGGDGGGWVGGEKGGQGGGGDGGGGGDHGVGADGDQDKEQLGESMEEDHLGPDPDDEVTL